MIKVSLLKRLNQVTKYKGIAKLLQQKKTTNCQQRKYHRHQVIFGCDFGCDFCPFLSTFVHSYKQQRPPKLAAFALKILKLALYARRDPWLRRPTTSSLRVFVFIILKAFFIFTGCDLATKTFSKLALYTHKTCVCATTLATTL